MSNLLELKKQLEDLNHAQSLKEYQGEYLFEFIPALGEQDFSHPHVRELIEACNQTNVNFLPDVVTQSIEMEAFNRFKTVVTRHVEGKSIATLMAMKNDIERQMLTSQIKLVEGRIAALEPKEEPKQVVKHKEAKK